MGDSPYDRARRDALMKIFEELALPEHLLTAFLQNPSRDLPYHGNRHELTVALLALRGGFFAERELDHKEMKFRRQALFLGGLFHDHGYELTRIESENIAHAAETAEELLQDNPRLSQRVGQLIRSTEFPHRHPGTPDEAVIQDADVLMISQPDFPQFLEGLARENPARAVDPLFPGLSGLNTTWGKNIYSFGVELQESEIGFSNPALIPLIGMTFHIQAMSSRGFLVDRSIRDYLEKLWKLGYETRHSCGGDAEADVPTPGWEKEPMKGYVSFPEPSEAQEKLIEKAAKSIGREISMVTVARENVIIVRFAHEEGQKFFETLQELTPTVD